MSGHQRSVKKLSWKSALKPLKHVSSKYIQLQNDSGKLAPVKKEKDTKVIALTKSWVLSLVDQ